MTHVRQAAVAGTFYPGSAAALDAAVRTYLAEAPAPGAGDPAPKAIIAPHAGYIYSGGVAAAAYARFRPLAGRVRRVVLLGPCHRVAVRGLAVAGADAFATPLGRLPVDAAGRESILALPQVSVFDATHADEHSLEVHLPFIQEVFGDVAIVPLVVGRATAEDVAEVIERLWGGDETVFVVSSDLSHYLDYETARRVDAATCRAIETLDAAAIGFEQACGRVPVAGLLTVARRRGLAVTTLDLRNSGDTAGDRRRVVGYGAWMFTEPAAGRRAAVDDDPAEQPAERAGEPPERPDGFASATRALLDRWGRTLLQVAAASIRHGVVGGRPLTVDPAGYAAELRDHGACFVTLERESRLRGCIGSPAACRPLICDVAENAWAAAFSDSRFPKLRAAEVSGLGLSISVLSPPEELQFAGEAQLLAQLRPGVDGLIIDGDGRRALFLPAVWATLPKPAVFLWHLKQKAGLDGGSPAVDLRAWRFHTVAVTSADLADPAALWA